MDQLPRPIESPIDIWRRGQLVTRAVVERWTMPDGRCGVKWGGLVFPLLDGGRIETTDQATPPAMCRPLIEPNPSWRLERGGTDADAYVFLDGDGATLERALHDLSVAGLMVQRSGPNLAGSAGDWFIRLASPGPDAEAILARTLGEAPPTRSVSNSEGLRERLLTEALEAAAAARERLRADLDNALARAASASESALELTNLRSSAWKKWPHGSPRPNARPNAYERKPRRCHAQPADQYGWSESWLSRHRPCCRVST